MPQSESKISRRQFVRASTLAAAGAAVAPYIFTGGSASAAAADSELMHSVKFGCIGCNPVGRWSQVYRDNGPWGPVVALANVDRNHAEKAKQMVGGQADIYEDYRKLLDRKDVQAVTITTPDHWHTKIAIDAMKAGKDVYCEKPLTLTIDEGKQICKVVKETGRVFQVGTQQRTEFHAGFLMAVAMVHEGRIGKLKRITVAIGNGPKKGPFPAMPVPDGLNWEMWQGQAPEAIYTEHRCHGDFRWWYAYSGGKMTDWGVHHVDIATWAMKRGDSGPATVEGFAVFPNVPNGFETALTYQVSCKYDDGVELLIRDGEGYDITFEGEKGWFGVDRGSRTGPGLWGPAADALKDHPLPEDAVLKLHGGKPLGNHMANFLACVQTREQPISDVFTHHRAITTCHLANIAIRLNRKINWDPVKQEITGDEEANGWLKREQRAPYKIEA